MHGGGRYSLPTFGFEEVLHGPQVGQPFRISSDPGSLVAKRDFGVLVGGDLFVTRNLALRTTLNFGLVDLIDDAAEERQRNNHSSSLNVGLKYLIR